MKIKKNRYKKSIDPKADASFISTYSLTATGFVKPCSKARTSL